MTAQAQRHRTFVLVSPHLTGEDVAGFQRDLSDRFNKWEIAKRVDATGEYDAYTRHAAKQVCRALGIDHVTAMRHGVTPDLRTKIRHPEHRSREELRAAERRADYRLALRERYAGKGVKRAIEYAQEQVGVRETSEDRGPEIDTWIKHAGYDPADGIPWCGCFVNACLMHAGFASGSSWGIGAVESIYRRAKGEIGGWEWVSASDGKAGDLACVKGSSSNPWRHVELVEKRLSATTYRCIGGNTSMSNGGALEGVARHDRTTTAAGGTIAGFARPPYHR